MRPISFPKERHTVVVLDATLDDMPLDCCDHDRVHVWLWCPNWSVRRAFATQGSVLLAANGGDPDNPTAEAVEALRGQDFYAEFEFPPYEPENGEFIEFRNVMKCPPVDQLLAPLQARWQAECDHGGDQA